MRKVGTDRQAVRVMQTMPKEPYLFLGKGSPTYKPQVLLPWISIFCIFYLPGLPLLLKEYTKSANTMGLQEGLS